MAKKFSENPNYYPSLDGIRGFAILSVVLLHNFSFVDFFRFGWLGVDLFFVLSGFLITEILLNRVNNPNFLRNFYMRRILRIFPLFYLLLILCLFVLPAMSSLDLNMSYYAINQYFFWTFFQNWLFIFTPSHSHYDNLLLHTWSLGIEEQFYLIWPVFVLLIRKPRNLLIVAIFILAILAIMRFLLWTYKIEGLAYANLFTFTRIDGLCVGCIIAVLKGTDAGWLKKHMLLLISSIVALNLCFFLIDSLLHSLPYFALIGYTTFATLFGLLVYASLFSEFWLVKFVFSNRILKFFGKISYGLYVYHWPIYVLCFPLLLKILQTNLYLGHQNAVLFSSVIVTLAGIIVSVLSFQYFESFFLNLKKHFP